MFGTLKTIEEQNLYASFGIVDGLSNDELMEINGGGLINGCGVHINIGCIANKTDSLSCHGGGSGYSGGSSGSSS